MNPLRILHLDLETAPNLAHVWSLWKQDVSLSQLQAPGYVLCWAAKWDGEREVMFSSVHQSSPKAMLAAAHALLAEADVVVTYNGLTFDIPTLNAEFAQHGMAPPAPYRQVDLYQVVRRQFRFPSYKLAYVAQALGVGSKVKHEGHLLWTRCMAGDDAAWRRMERYNRGDVRLQERVYRRILPWVPNHPNHALYAAGDRPVCPNCGGTRLQRRGTAITAVQRYARFQCVSCGAWCRSATKDGESKPTRRRC